MRFQHFLDLKPGQGNVYRVCAYLSQVLEEYLQNLHLSPTRGRLL